MLAAVQTTLIMTQKTVGQNASRLDQTQQAKTAVDAMSKSLRTAVLPALLGCQTCDSTAFIQGTSNSVSFYANMNNDSNAIGPSRVSYTVNANGDLVETIQPPNAHAANDFSYTYCTPGPGCAVLTRVLARRVPTSLAIFTYYDANGTVVTPPSDGDDPGPGQQHRPGGQGAGHQRRDASGHDLRNQGVAAER